jgi:hypothetical protein
MKHKGRSFVLGICLAILALPANPLFARSSTAFGSFHVQSATVLKGNDYDCITENNGAAVNNCTHEVNLLFGLVLDTTGTKSITVQNYWSMTSGSSFSCTAYGYTGTGGGSLTESPAFVFTAEGQSITQEISVPETGMSVQLICWKVPAGDGVANINWNP